MAIDNNNLRVVEAVGCVLFLSLSNYTVGYFSDKVM